MSGTVIIGAGQAGQQVAESLRAGGYADPIALLGDEPHLPYQLPPLSKGYLKGSVDRQRLAYRSESFYADKFIELHRSARVEAVNLGLSAVLLENGTAIPFEHLVFATGSRPVMPPIPGIDSANVCTMRTLDDADRFAQLVGDHQRFAVLGAGFIGLEAAASLIHFGKQVTVIEAQPRVMARVVSPLMSGWFEDLHRNNGITLALGSACSAIEQTADGLRVKLSDGSAVECDVLLVGVGALPNEELAAAAGITCKRGIFVDAQQRTSADKVWAAGDCALQHNPFWGEEIRLESVQNAMDQAKVIAANILDGSKTYDAVPWFWSDQFDAKYQMAGLGKPEDDLVTLGDPANGKFSVAHFRGGALACVESVNQPGDHMATRQLLGQVEPVTPAELVAAGDDLKALFKARR